NKIEYVSDGTYQSVSGLMLKFSGVNNMVVIEDGATFKDSTILLNSGGYVHLGNSKYNNLSILNNNIGGKVFIGNSCIIDKQLDIYLNGDNCCKIGDGCVIGSDVKICCQDEHSLLDSNGYLLNPGQPINIGDRVWIGSRVMLLKGTHISDECYVSAGCIVENKFFTSNQIISGAPANTISSGVTWAMSSPENYRCK
ncbi:TPA: acetyltransferase, partial [Escherichia coli]